MIRNRIVTTAWGNPEGLSKEISKALANYNNQVSDSQKVVFLEINGDYYKGTVKKEDRSLMNVPFVTGNEELDAKFVKEATEAGLVNLKGHRTVGGMRASIYNAMPIDGVKALVEFMEKFEKENG